MNKIHLTLLLITLTLISCGKSKQDREINNATIAKTEILKKEYDFGTIKVGDTVNHIFYIKNISNQDLKINNIGTSCGCTSIGKIDSLAKKGEKLTISIQFIAKKEQTGRISNSAVVEMNTNPPFSVFRLKGNVIN